MAITSCVLVDTSCYPMEDNPRRFSRSKCILLVVLLVLWMIYPYAIHAEAVVEGRVSLSGSRGRMPVGKRYQVVTTAGLISTNPPIAVVYLEGRFTRSAALTKAQMVQKGLSFSNPVLPVQVGTVVEFPNLDDTYHNIFSYSKAKRFDLGRYLSTERPVPFQIFEKAGIVSVHCDIHEHMHGVIIVLDTPHFVCSGTDGRFRLAGLPSGRFTLKAWVDSRTTLEKTIDLVDGSTCNVNLP